MFVLLAFMLHIVSRRLRDGSWARGPKFNVLTEWR
jgi:hypothetical protein